MDYPVASPRLPSGVNAHFEKQARREDRAVFNVVCDDLGTLCHLAATAQTVILAPDFAVQAASTVPLVRLPMKKLSNMQTHYSLVMAANRTLPPAALAFSGLVQEMMAPAKQ
jgi:DNA-binding transcriptional LysR family regulator